LTLNAHRRYAPFNQSLPLAHPLRVTAIRAQSTDENADASWNRPGGFLFSHYSGRYSMDGSRRLWSGAHRSENTHRLSSHDHAHNRRSFGNLSGFDMDQKVRRGDRRADGIGNGAPGQPRRGVAAMSGGPAAHERFTSFPLPPNIHLVSLYLRLQLIP
jgi:hypothetical protein